MTIKRAYRTGDEVEWQEGRQRYRGKIITYREIGDRLVLRVGRPDGQVVTVALDPEGVPGLNSPVSVPEALKLAKAIVAGQEPRMPVATQINILALAVIQQAERAPEGTAT